MLKKFFFEWVHALGIWLWRSFIARSRRPCRKCSGTPPVRLQREWLGSGDPILHWIGLVSRWTAVSRVTLPRSEWNGGRGEPSNKIKLVRAFYWPSGGSPSFGAYVIWRVHIRTHNTCDYGLIEIISNVCYPFTLKFFVGWKLTCVMRKWTKFSIQIFM